MKHRGAFTLIELLIAVALTALLVVMLVAFLLMTLRTTARGNVQAALQAQATLALNYLVKDLQQTSSAGLSLAPGALGIVSIREVTGQRALVWDEELVVYSWSGSDRRLVRKTWPPAPPALDIAFDPTRPPKVSPADLVALGETPNGTQRILAWDVEEFEVAHPGSGSSLGMPLTLRLYLRRKAVGSAPTETFEATRTVMLRNHGNPQ